VTRRTAAALLGGAAVLTVGVLLALSLFLQRAPGPAAPPPTARTVSRSTPAEMPPTTIAPPVDGEQDGADAEPTQSGGADATPGSVPYSRTTEARRQWQPVVVGFGRDFTRTDHRSVADWRGGLNRYVTTAVQKQLRTVDPRNVPSGAYAGFEVDSYDEEAVTVKVTYREGWSLILYVIDDGETWRIYRYDRWEE
jgi:hypothetical protein